MIRLVPVALLLAVVAVGFSGGTSAAPPGTCRVHMSGATDYSPLLDTALPDGSIVVGSSYVKRDSGVVQLRRVLPNCHVVPVVVLQGAGPEDWGIDAIAATPDGRILLAGRDGRRVVVFRFFANGKLFDRSFGNGGLVRFRPYKHRRFGNNYGFTATSLALGPDGTIVVGGVDGGAHCCVRSFVSELTPDGVPIKTFGHDGSRVVPIIGAYAADVFVNPDRSVYAFGQHQGSGCGAPGIVRVLPDGSLDHRFDSAIARTVKRIVRPRLRFTPTLVPDGSGGFTLVGGLDRTCGIPSHTLPSSGVSLRVGADGSIVGGLTHFYSPHYAFDSPVTLRLPSGRILAAGRGVSSTLIQVFGPDGSRDPSIGDHGLFRVARGPDDALVDLLPAGDGSAWLVTGAPHEIDLTPLPVR